MTTKQSPTRTGSVPKKKQATEKLGVIATIVSLLEDSGDQGITKQEILDKLIKQFPDRSADGMKNTVNVQVPHRVSKERFKLEKLEGGLYRKAK